MSRRAFIRNDGGGHLVPARSDDGSSASAGDGVLKPGFAGVRIENAAYDREPLLPPKLTFGDPVRNAACSCKKEPPRARVGNASLDDEPLPLPKLTFPAVRG